MKYQISWEHTEVFLVWVFPGSHMHPPSLSLFQRIMISSLFLQLISISRVHTYVPICPLDSSSFTSHRHFKFNLSQMDFNIIPVKTNHSLVFLALISGITDLQNLPNIKPSDYPWLLSLTCVSHQ